MLLLTLILYLCVDMLILLCHGAWVGRVVKYFVIVMTNHISSNRGLLQIEASFI